MRQLLYSCIALVFVLSACSAPRTAEKSATCNSPKTVDELVACAGQFGTVKSYEIRLTSVLNDASKSCPGFEAWNAGDTALVVVYADTTVFWRVANVKPDYGTWVQGINPRNEGLSKSDVINLYALPNCAGTGRAWWAECSIQKNCDCPCVERMPADSVIKYIEKVVLPPSTAMVFGVAGANTWGYGGGLQWKLRDTNVASFIVETSDWK